MKRTGYVLFFCLVFVQSATCQYCWNPDPRVNTLFSRAVQIQYNYGDLICIEARTKNAAHAGVLFGYLETVGPWFLVATKLDTLGCFWMKASLSEPEGNLSFYFAYAPIRKVGVFSDGRGGVVGVYSGNHSTYNRDYDDVFAGRLDSARRQKWRVHDRPYNVVICDAPGEQNLRAAISDGEACGGFIGWIDKRDSTGKWYAQHVDSSGTSTWTWNGVPVADLTVDDYGTMDMDMVLDGRGGVLLAMAGMEINGTFATLTLQRLDSLGSRAWGANGIAVDSFRADHVLKGFIDDGAGGAIVCWEGVRTQGQRHLLVQRVDSIGTRLWGPNGTTIDTLDPWYNPVDVTTDMRGGIIVVRFDSSANMVWGQRIDWNGTKRWGTNGAFLVSAYKPRRLFNDIPFDPTVVSDERGGAIVAYPTVQPGRYHSDIFAQRVDSNGTVLWSSSGVPVCTQDSNTTDRYSDQWCPKAVSDGSGGAYIGWMDGRFPSQLMPFTGISFPTGFATRIRANGSAYPVSLARFSARLADERVLLDWATANETINYGFEVQRTTETGIATGAWEVIAFVPGHGNTDREQTYRYEDNLPPALLDREELFYRLKQIDFDGSSSWSHIVSVRLPAATAEPVLFEPYPNPGSDETHLKVHLPSATETRLFIVNTLGQEVRTISAGRMDAGYHAFPLRATDLPSGIYGCILDAGGCRKMRKLMVVR
jgi:hypothetical protein